MKKAPWVFFLLYSLPWIKTRRPTKRRSFNTHFITEWPSLASRCPVYPWFSQNVAQYRVNSIKYQYFKHCKHFALDQIGTKRFKIAEKFEFGWIFKIWSLTSHKFNFHHFCHLVQTFAMLKFKKLDCIRSKNVPKVCFLMLHSSCLNRKKCPKSCHTARCLNRKK